MGFEMIGRSVLCNKLDALSETLEIEEKKIFVQQKAVYASSSYKF